MLPRLRWLKGLSLVSKTYLSAYQEEESNSCRILSENLMQILQKKKKESRNLCSCFSVFKNIKSMADMLQLHHWGSTGCCIAFV